MSVRWYSVVVDCNDVSVQSRWWARVLDWRIIYEDPNEVVVVPPYVGWVVMADPEDNEFCVLSPRD